MATITIERPLIVMAIIVATLIALWGVCIGLQLVPPEVTAIETQHVGHLVNIGDTLWSIAQRYRPDEDPRRVIWEIQQDNGIGSVIHPGDIIRVRQPS